MSLNSNNISNAVKPHREGILISIFVTPQSSESKFPTGYNQWRRCLEIKVQSPALDNKANKEVIKLISLFFKISNRDIDIISGIHSRVKQVLIRSISYDDAIKRIMGNIE